MTNLFVKAGCAAAALSLLAASADAGPRGRTVGSSVSRTGTTINGAAAMTGPRGVGAANGSVTYSPRTATTTASGTANFTSNDGKSVTATGQAAHADDATSAQGSVTTGSGATLASGQASLSHTDDSAQGAASVTTAKGVTRSVTGSAADGSATITGGQGQTKTVTASDLPARPAPPM